MPRRTITSENRAGTGGPKFPRLEFKNKGDRHRVLLFQMDEEGQAVVWQEWVHVLRVPVFKEDGMPKMTLKDSKRDGGEKYEDYDTDWLGTPLCLGDPEVNEKEGFDSSNCPICVAVPNAPPEAKLHPQLALAANVVEYALAPGSWNVQRPLSANVVIWRMSPGTYDEIISQQEQHGELLRKQDLTLEVVNPGFRTVKMGVMAPSGWQETESGAAYLSELLGTPGNIASDEQLRNSCGRDAKRLFMEEDLAVSLKKWRKAKLALEGPEAGPATPAPDLAAGVNELLNSSNPAATAQQVAEMRDQTRKEVSEILNPGNPFSEFTQQNAQAAAETAHAQATTSAPAADPFAATATASHPPAAAASPPAASPQTALPSDPFGAAVASVPASSSAAADPFAAAAQQSAAVQEPTTAASPESPGAAPVSFEQMISSLEPQAS